MNKSTDKKSSSSEIEFAFEEVPDSARKSLGSILVILTGYTISLSNFVTGATVGFKMPFQQAILACGLGNLMLIAVATLLGIISCRTGLTTSVPVSYTHLSSAEELERLYEGVAQICLEQGALDVLISDTEERDESIWKARGAFLEAIKGSTTCMDEVDIVVPRSRVDALVEYTHGLQAELGVRIKSFGHAGDGNLHAYILRDGLPDGVWEEKLALAMEKLYERGRQLCGQVSGEHGIGYAKRAYLSESLPPRILALMRAVKRTFDPKGILNPHKVCEP